MLRSHFVCATLLLTIFDAGCVQAPDGSESGEDVPDGDGLGPVDAGGDLGAGEVDDLSTETSTTEGSHDSVGDSAGSTGDSAGPTGDSAGPTGDSSGSTGDGTGSTGDDGDSTGGGTGSTGSESDADTDSTGGASSEDEGTGDEGGHGPDMGTPEGCKNVDVLFVIDNSASMEDQQQSLVNSFPGFVQSMRDTLMKAKSYHVGVTTSDAYAHHAAPCTKMLGAFVRETGGSMSSSRVCGPFVGGGRYMTEVDDLESEFECVGRVGLSGSGSERPIAALVAALSSDLQRPGTCNAGFLREDALLVVVIISDEDDVSSSGDPQTWHSDLVAAKGGRDDHVVLLSMVGQPDSACVGSRGAATNLLSFTSLFTHAQTGDVCASNYDDYFREAVEVIDLACDDFDPPV